MFSRLSQEESTVFGATLRRFIECTFDAEECDPQVGLFKFPRYFDISMLLFVIFIIVHDNSLIIIVNLFFFHLSNCVLHYSCEGIHMYGCSFLDGLIC